MGYFELGASYVAGGWLVVLGDSTRGGKWC